MKSQSILPTMLQVGSNSNIVQEEPHQQLQNSSQHTNTDKKFLQQQIAKGWNMQRYNLLPEITKQGRGRALSDVSLLLRHTLDNGHSALSTTFSDDNDAKICNNYTNQGNNLRISISNGESFLSNNHKDRTDQTLEIPIPSSSGHLKEKRALPPINLEAQDNSRPRFMTVLDSAPPPASVLTMSASEIIPCSDDPRENEHYI